MGSTKEKRFNSANETLNSEQSPPQISQFLLLALEAPEGLKPSGLKSLYCMLIHLSSNPPTYCSKYGADICRVSNILFMKLFKRFEQFISTLNDASSTQALGQAGLHSDMWAIVEELNLLLRCCMVISNLFVPKKHLLENGRVLLAMLRKLCSLDSNGGNEKNDISFEKLVSHEYTYVDNNCSAYFTEDFVASLRFVEPSDPCLPFLCTILEVFADELLVHGQLREYFKLIDSLSSTSEMLFVRHSSHGDIGSVMEVIATHFSLSFSNEQAFENFLKQLFWLHGKDYCSFELSLTAAISLLLNPVLLSAPKFFQAYLISLVSKATGIGMSVERMRPNLRLMDCYLSAFERSVILYTKHMSTMQMDGYPTGAEDWFAKSSMCGGNIQPTFESIIQPFTRNKINHLISKLNNSWNSHLHNMFIRTKSDLVKTSIAYIKECQHVLDISCRDEIVSILSCIILGAYSSDDYNSSFNTNGDSFLQDICLLASIVKLMSSSLLQAIQCLRHGGNLGCPRTLKNFSSCKEYDSIAAVISCFKKFNIHLPIQRSLCDMMEIHPTQHKESKLMLIHFSGLLSLCFVSGLDFLVKGCILTMMTLMNLFIFEEGNLNAFKLLIDSRSGSFLSELLSDNVQEAVDQRSSVTVASKFQSIRTLYLSADSLSSNCTGSADGQSEISTNSSVGNNKKHVVAIEEETNESCNGEIFLNCILKCPNQLSDIDDLADFIECKQGKDYSGWLKDRQRYRRWKYEKMAVLRWEKKRKTWKYMKGKKT